MTRPTRRLQNYITNTTSNFTMLVRIRSKDGLDRIELQPTDDAALLLQKFITIHPRTDSASVTISTKPKGEEILLSTLAGQTISALNIKHGDLLYATFVDTATVVPVTNGSSNGEALPSTFPVTKADKHERPIWEQVQEDSVDTYLEKQDGKIQRGRDTMCKHGPQGMCDYCMPVEPYDAGYLEEHKIKHLSFHSYLRKLDTQVNRQSTINTSFIPPLEAPDYRVKTDCKGGHAPWPAGICTKCQPTAITLQLQQFRNVDHVEFSDASLIDNFINFWRATGAQRLGYLYGRYEPYTEVPLGIKAVVEAIYEPPQEGEIDGLTLGMPWDAEKVVDHVASLCGLQRVGVIYSDLTDDGTGLGTVLGKRHADSYFLSSLETCFSAEMQRRHESSSRFSSTGKFGSKFVTCVVSGNVEGGIDVQAYQVSNNAMAMIEADIIEPSVEPGTMRVRDETATRYVPDVFYKYKNKYGVNVQENAKPCFPVEYLLVTLTHGFPSNPNPLFKAKSRFAIENRMGMQTQDLQAVGRVLSNEADMVDNLGDFHLVSFLAQQGMLAEDELTALAKAATSHQMEDVYGLVEKPGWQTLMTIIKETANDAPMATASAGGSASGSASVSGVATPAERACPHCTFVNGGNASSCEMCGLPLDS